jgi:hypothetical protein
MFRNRCSSAVTACLIVCAAGLFGFAQEQKQAGQPSDAIARVPALESFHEVIRLIWHDAWPNKNIP